MNFDKLDILLKERGISRRQLALAIGINVNTMGTAFKRRSGLSAEDVLRIAEYLGVSPYYLEGWASDPQAGEIDNGSFTNVFEDKQKHDRMSSYDSAMDYKARVGALLEAFDKLNTYGQFEAVRRVDEMTYYHLYRISEDEYPDWKDGAIDIPEYTKPDIEQGE